MSHACGSVLPITCRSDITREHSGGGTRTCGAPRQTEPRRSRLRKFLLPLAALTLTSGCGAYLHNPSRATATADLKSRAERLTAPAYFEAQEKNLSDLAQREDLALAELLTASRDYRLLNVMRPSTAASERISRESRLNRLLAADLGSSYGSQYLTSGRIKALTTSAFIRATALREIEFKRERVATTASQYKSSGGTLPTNCQSVLANPNPTHGDPNLDRRYSRLLQACNAVAADEIRLGDCALGATAGDLSTVCIQAANLQDDPLAVTRRKQLTAAEKALREAMKASKPSAEADAIKEANQLIQEAEKLPSDEGLKSILTQVEKLFGESLGTTLREINADAGTTASEVSEPLAAALTAIGAAYQYRDARRVKPMETASALLIGIAKIRHDLNILDIDIAARRADREIVFQQAEALRRQLYYLAQAQKSLCDGEHQCAVTSNKLAFSEALSFYVRSQNVGRAPYEILSFRRLQLKRATALKHAKATEADYRSLIQPAIDQLAAFGAGGVKAETIANFLSSLPVPGAMIVE